MKVNEQHDKYCPHSKFANKLCKRCFGNRCDACNLMQDKTGWEVCAIPSQQVEVVEKHLVDQVVDDYYNGAIVNDKVLPYITRNGLKEIVELSIKRLESEKKPCEWCEDLTKGHAGNYCCMCARKL